MRRVHLWRRRGAAEPVWVWLVRAALLTLLPGLLLAGCTAGVNEDLAATATPRMPGDQASPPARLILADRNTTLRTLLVADPAAELARVDERIESGSDSAEARSTRGLLSLRMGDLTSARADFAAALAAEPGSAAAYTGRGLVAVTTAQGDQAGYTAALQDFNRALTLDPGTTTARLGRGWTFLQRASYRGERSDWETALAEGRDKRLRDEPLAQAIVAFALVGLGDLDQERQTLAGAMRAVDGEEPGVRAAVLMTVDARLALSAGEPERALERAQAALAIDSFQWEARRIEVSSLLELGQFEEARDAANALTADIPGDGYAWFLYATALHQSGDQAGAVAALTRAMELLTHAPAYSATILQMSQELGLPASPSSASQNGPATGAWSDPNGRPHALYGVRW
ncbi:MAG: tetratricopeptide repeat protein [Chloroflexia bacterium]|nr:tetratricopeptide repeat protein [Chloroflexia bacterium]